MRKKLLILLGLAVLLLISMPASAYISAKPVPRMPGEYTGTIIQAAPVGWEVWTHRIDPNNPWSTWRDDDMLPWYAYPAPGVWEVYTSEVPPMYYDEYFQVEIDPAYRTYITIVPEIDKWSFYDD